jgi:hypothetical protein
MSSLAGNWSHACADSFFPNSASTRNPNPLNPGEITVNKTLSTCLLSIAILAPLAATAADPLVRFEDGIGSQPLRAGGVANTVLGVNPGGAPWVISRLSVDVSTDGSIRVDGRGLVLAGTDNVGTPGGQSVRARLFCGGVAAGDSDLVPLDARGDFRITGFLTQTPPNPCNHPVLLIVNATGAWFAAGI